MLREFRRREGRRERHSLLWRAKEVGFGLIAMKLAKNAPQVIKPLLKVFGAYKIGGAFLRR